MLGFDFGTTNMKAVLADSTGKVLGVHREKITYRTDASGRCELAPPSFVESMRVCVEGVCAIADVEAAAIGAVSYASQANSFLLVDRDGDAVSPILSWQDSHVVDPDRKTVELWDRPSFLTTTGLGIFSPGLAVVKLAELQASVVWKPDVCFMSVSDYAMYLLTGDRVGDSSTASMLGLYDIRSEGWWPEALSALGIEEAQLPSPVTPGLVAGNIDVRGSHTFGLKSGVPVIAGGLDHYVAAIGAGTETLASACESTGTVVACIFTGEGIDVTPGACLGPGIDGNYLLTFDDRGGTVLEQYRSTHCPDLSFAEIDELAELSGIGACGITAVIGDSGAPDFSASATSSETDVSAGSGAGSRAPGSTKIDMDDASRTGCEARAILEATAFRLRSLVHAAVHEELSAIVSTGGGAKSPIWTKIKASVLDTRFITVEPEEPAAYGAAFLAARGAGVLANQQTGLPESWISVRSVVEPDASDVAAYHVVGARYGAA